ncbi:MAG: hypothetical protein EBT63_06825, partial [Proteobacteria bacterium]|nr:hypothetical protein [Pseudomonadota bacterium]
MQIKNFYTATLLKKFLVGFAIFFVFSCDNYGCVETDDFGEYDSYSFPVYANNLENLCKFDRKKDPSDSTQGVVFRKIYEKDNCLKNTEVERITCGLKVEKLCKINPNLTVEEKQQIFRGVAPKSLSETPWIGIGGSNGIKIEEDSRILINAVGEINLGENSIKDPANINDNNKDDFGDPDKNSSKLIHSSINKSEISGNENLFVNFWGKFVSNGTTYLYGADQYIDDLNSNPPQKSISDNRLNYYINETYSAGAKRILAYFIPFPNYVQIGADKKNISALFPNPKSWNCVLSDNGSNDNIRCSNNTGLNDLDKYTTAEDVELNNLTSDEERTAYNDKYTKLYQVDNLSKNRMYENTGFIRFEGDGFVGSNNYLDSSSANIIDINLALIPTTFSKYQLQAPASKNYKLKFKKEGVCAGFKFSKDGADGTYEDVFVGSNPILFEVNPNEIDELYIKTTADNSNSGCTLKAHFYEFLEIPITKSGYVKFDYPKQNIYLNDATTALNNPVATINNCNLKFKIINTHKKPDGTYQYISELPEGIEETHNMSSNSSKKYFFRKGQKIIFSPESWNGSWSIAGNSNNNNYTFTFQCGKGFYMNHTPRPAVFCSNKKLKELIDINKDLDPSNDCSPYFDPNLKKETGCADDYLKSCAQLYGSGNSINTNFCPAQCIDFNYFDTNCRPTCDASGSCTPPSSTNCNPIINSTYCGELCSVSTCKNFTDYAEIEPYKSQLNPATLNP